MRLLKALRMYDLVAVVIHCGSGPNRGHYISIVKSCGFWLIFDDDIVDVSYFNSFFSLFRLVNHIMYVFLYRKLNPLPLKTSMDLQLTYKNLQKLDIFYSINREIAVHLHKFCKKCDIE